MPDFHTFHQSLNTDPAKRGKQFEHFVKWFLANEPEWATQVAQVWLWDEYPERWGIDCGIDLVFRHKNGELWAVQAKCYSPDHDITKHDVDKFLSESSRSSISKRLLIATTDRIGANARQVCDAQEKTVVRYLLSNFENAEIDYPARFEDLYQAKPKARPTPHPHQNEAIAAVKENFDTADRGQLIMACGTGKTYTTLWIKEQLGANSTLVLVPSLSLLSQTLKEWTFAATHPFAVLCVCSDQTVGKRGEDEAIHTVADLAFPVTSDVGEIRQFLRGEGTRVVFSTYQSSPLIAEAQASPNPDNPSAPQPPPAPPCQGESQSAPPLTRGGREGFNPGGQSEIQHGSNTTPVHAEPVEAHKPIPPFDLIIADEAHRCAGKTGRDFSAVLDGNLIRASKHLFATATPRTYAATVHKAAEERGIEVFGMDDEAVFGKVFYSLSFPKAIQKGLLTDYRVVIIGVDNPTIAEWIRNRELVSISLPRPPGEGGGEGAFQNQKGQPSQLRETDSESLAARIGLLKAIKDYDLKRIISFHSRVKRAEEFAGDIQDVLGWVEERHKPDGTLWTDFVSGVMPTSKRKQKLDHLKAIAGNQRGILTNARCLSEGVDVPSLDGVAFIDPKNSQVDIVQAVGRAIRLSADKKFGTIVLPVFIKQGEDAAASIEASNFKPVWEILNALKSHDEGLAFELDQLRTEMGKRPGTKIGAEAFSKIVVDLPATVDATFGDSLRTYLVEQTTASWNFWYGLLEGFVEVNGNARVSANYVTHDSYKLGTWVSNQRVSKSKNQLNQDRIARLESLHGWLWDILAEQWEEGYWQLEQYATLHGNARVPNGHVTHDGYKLRNWVNTQRNSRSMNQLSQDRIVRLESLTGWLWDILSEQWEEGFGQLQQYVTLHGNASVPQRYVTHKDYGLGSWVGGQRRSRLKNQLSQDRIARLESLHGWSWNPLSEVWEEGFRHLAQYVTLHGNARIPQGQVAPDGYKLGIWISMQRRSRSRNLLSQDRIARLESLLGWSWDILSEQWEEGFRQLEQYAALHGNARVPQRYVTPEGYKLGQWIGGQRKSRLRNLLSQDRIERLESLPGWSWDILSEKWEDGYGQLEQYVTLHGNTRVPGNYVTSDGYKLGNWVANLRISFRSGKLSQDHIERIESFHGWSWEIRSEQWESGYGQLEQYVTLHGNARVPGKYITSEGYKLGSWVKTQRKAKSKNLFSQDRIERLESLPGWVWDAREN